MTGKFVDKAVLVTGAAAGLGRAIALGFAHEGAELIIADINLKGLRETAELIKTAGAKTSAHEVDFADESALKNFTSAVLDTHDRLDVLVNNAGIAYGEIAHSFTGLSLEKWQHFFTINSIAPVLLADALRPALSKAKGLIVNQSSIASYAPGTAYGVTKATLSAMTFAMAMHYASDEIRAVAIAPGFMKTEASTEQLPEETKERLKAMQSVKRQGKPEDIANLILFLASPEGNFINNEVIITDGGNQMRGWRP